MHNPSKSLNSYTSNVQGLATVRTADLHYHGSITAGLKSLQLAAAGAIIGCSVVLANHYIKPRVSAIQEKPVITQTQSITPPSLNFNQPDTEPTIKTAKAAVPVIDSNELQAIINKWRADYSNGTVGVYIQELGGDKRKANLNVSQTVEAASLYKLFIADYLYNNIDRGKLSFNSVMSSMTKNVGDCLKPMIVMSDNACGEGFGYSIGWPVLHNYVRAEGFKQTTMSPVNQTTAGDMGKYLSLLYSGKLIKNDIYRQQLIEYMKVQIYRYGIPAGVPGQTVANKVGSNPGYYHDAAIVYGPKSTYILAVVSENSSITAIKELSTRVAKFFDQ